MASDSSEELTTVEVDRSSRVWIGGAEGGLLRSDDGGRAFAQVARSPRLIRGLWSDGERRLVVCAGGEIVASDDGGVTWAPTSCRGKHNDNLRERGGMLLATNIRSRVLISSDGGRRWKSLETGARRYLYSVAGNRDGMLCAGSDEAVVVSKDRGASWRVVPLEHREYLRGAHVRESGEIVLVGDGGKIHLGDRAAELSAAHAEDGPSLYAVSEVERALVAVGHRDYSPAFAYSEDGGRNWRPEHADDVVGAGRVLAVCGLPDGTFVAAGDRGGIWVRTPP